MSPYPEDKWFYEERRAANILKPLNRDTPIYRGLPGVMGQYNPPPAITQLETIGQAYYDLSQTIMTNHQEGLTRTYNRFHNSAETNARIQRLRALHIEMARAVADVYGWTDLDLSHGFHETRQGVRFTVSEPARRDVLDRLLALNHEHYKEEVAQGLHDKGTQKNKKKAAAKPKSKKKQDDGQEELF